MTEAPSKAEDRNCGDCMLCCKLIGVHELEKPSGRMCQFAKKGVGCTIYKRRPTSCATYACMWLEGILPESMKPNKIKAVFHTISNSPTDNEKAALVNIDAMLSLEQWASDPEITRGIEALFKAGIDVFVRHGRLTFLWQQGHPRLRQIATTNSNDWES